MASHKRDVHGHTVLGEDNALNGIDYLDHDLDFKEAEVFFKQARYKGQVEFEDDKDRDFTLIYNQDGTYAVELRKSGGWF